jgi:phosphate transport system permease protein
MAQADTNPPAPAPVEPLLLTRAGAGFGVDAVMRGLTTGAAVVILLMLAALVAVLFHAARPSIDRFGWAFITNAEWRPNDIVIEQTKLDATGRPVIEDGEVVKEVVQTRPAEFGALAVIWGTAISSLIALVVAVPLSIGTAMFLVRIAPRWLVAPVSFLVEFLAAIPSIAYGIWGLFILTPFLQTHVEPAIQGALGSVPGLSWMFRATFTIGGESITRPMSLTGRDMFAGGLILGIMILPIITAISRDVLRAVPRTQIEGTLALGATWWQSCREMIRYSRAGLFGAVMLGLARAAGETMAVTMVIGNNNQIMASPFAPAQTMASLLANEFAEATSDLHRAALTHVALILLMMSLLFNIIARWLVVGKGARTAAAH